MYVSVCMYVFIRACVMDVLHGFIKRCKRERATERKSERTSNERDFKRLSSATETRRPRV